LTDVFNERTYTLLRVIRDEEPASIRETARLVGRDKKNVHEELTTLEALGVIRFEEDGRAKRPVFPYTELVVTPLAGTDGDGTPATP
jgi:predicted transcriptional regulator